MKLARAGREFDSLSLLVVGDLMLDERVEGEGKGSAREAPAPVLSVRGRKCAPGGAANVAAGVAALGARAMVCGAIGDDREGRTLRAELERSGVEPIALVEDGRSTTVKTRVLGDDRLLLRMDRESRQELAPPAADAVVDASRGRIDEADAVVISDYRKGVATREICSALTRMAARAGVPLVVNTKSERPDSFRGATLVSVSEDAAAMAGAASDGGLARLAVSLGHTALLVTRADRGMTLWRSGRRPLELEALSDQVVDVTGAGDAVCAAIAVALAAGCSLNDSLHVANAAAAVAVESPGTMAVPGSAVASRLVQDSRRATAAARAR